MRWIQPGWFLGHKKWADSKHIAYVLTPSRGMWKGMLRGKAPIACSWVRATWKARKLSDLGTFYIEELDSRIGIASIHDPKTGSILMALREAIINWCCERDESAYRIFTETLASLSPQSLQLALQRILQETCGIDATALSSSRIFEYASHQGMKKLPLCMHALLNDSVI